MLPPIQDIMDPITLRTEALYREEAEKNPDDADKLYRYGKFLQSERRNLVEARRLYERAIEKWPKLTEPFSTYLLYDYAGLLIEDFEEYEKAVQVLRRVIGFFPDSPTPYLLSAQVLSEKLHNYDGAEELLKRAVEVESSDVAARIAYADFLSEHRKDCDAAEALYLEAIARAATWPSANHVTRTALHHCAKCLGSCRGDFEGADALFQRSLTMDSGVSYEALQDYADLYASFGKSDAPVEAMFQGIRSDTVDWILLRVDFYMSRCRVSDGLALLEKALARTETGYSSWYTRSVLARCWVYALAFRPESSHAEALSHIKQLLEQGLRHPVDHLGRVVALAERDGHPDATWLRKLASVLEQKASVEVLNDWPAWATIEIKK